MANESLAELNKTKIEDLAFIQQINKPKRANLLQQVVSKPKVEAKSDQNEKRASLSKAVAKLDDKEKNNTAEVIKQLSTDLNVPCTNELLELA